MNFKNQFNKKFSPCHRFFGLKILMLSVILSACHSKKSDRLKTETVADTIPAVVETASFFPDLVPGEVTFDENAFGEIIELKGEQKKTDAIFEVRETQMLVNDSLLIMANLNSENRFMAFSLPGFQLVKSFGKVGRGPGEFQYPQLVPAVGNGCLCYIYERANNHLFSLNNDLSISELPFQLPEATTNHTINDKQVAGFLPGEFVYAESVKGGKAVFNFKVDGDSVQSRQIFNLSFSDAHKSWASYIGDFGANAEKLRVVYAYKYFKRLIFVDLKNNTSRTLIFDAGEAGKGDAISVMSPENVTHYWGMSAQSDFVYVLYSGRSPVDVNREWQKKQFYIFVEKYDWNGNPVAKYRLDNWGYFCADQKRGKIYLASVNDEQPFFVYTVK